MKRIFFILIIIGSVNLFSQENKNDNVSKLPNYDPRPISSPKLNLSDIPLDIKEKINSFFKEMINKNIQKSFDEISKNSTISQKPENIKQLVDNAILSIKLYGEIKSYDFVNSEKASDGLYKVRYLANHIDYPTRWIFTFYNSPKYGWIVLNIKFDDLPDFLFTGD